MKQNQLAARIIGIGLVVLLLLPTATVGQAARLPGAIFTTTPDGSIVNENVHYNSKLEVYLDGGPPPNAPASAAGLPAGPYVFQVTNPSGWVLLSEDPAKCRIVRVSEDGVIVELVLPSDLDDYGYEPLDDWYTVGNGNNGQTFPCHIQDEPDGIAGPSGRHDTNNDTDHGEDFGAIVVQLMPFLNTPNPGGVYKAWMIPLDRYVANGGDLEEIPMKWVKKKGVKLGFEPDPGFGPPRDQIKTDNFKVKEYIPPPELTVRKFHDLNANGMWDENEPELAWRVFITDPTSVTNEYYTPWTIIAEPPGDYIVEEEILDGWYHSVTYLDGMSLGIVNPVTVTVAGMYDEKHEVIFGNFMPADIYGKKFDDLNGNGVHDEGEPGVPDFLITLSGTDGKGTPVYIETTTDEYGEFCFMDLNPGTYTVTETVTDGWVNSTTTTVEVILESGDVVQLGYVFGNFMPACINGKKFDDLNGNGVYDEGELGVPNVQITLSGTDGKGDSVYMETWTDASGAFCFMDLWPGTYTVTEIVPSDRVPSTTTTVEVTLKSGDMVHLGYVFGNFIPADIYGKKFDDLNGNGVHDEGEPGVPDFLITLSGTDGKGTPVYIETTTDEYGEFCFMDLNPGTYTVTETVTDGWVNSTTTTVEVTLESGDVVQLGYVFGNFMPVDIYAHKFFDFNENGVQDEYEQDLAGIKICLTYENGILVTQDAYGDPLDACQFTDEDGMVYWMDLAPGTYIVNEDLAGSLITGLYNTTPTTVTVTLISGESVTVEFGNVGPCNGLTPGYWKNWRNHYTSAQFETLLVGTIAANIDEADLIFEHWDASDPSDLTILKAFVLANQLTINLTQHPELPNPSSGSLFYACLLTYNGDTWSLGEALAIALEIISDPYAYDPAYILYIKDILDAFANQRTCDLCTP